MTAYCIETDGVTGYVKFAGLFSSSNIPNSFTLMATIKVLETNTSNNYRPIGVSNSFNIGINANQYRTFIPTDKNDAGYGSTPPTLSGTVSRNVWVKLCLIVDFTTDTCKLFINNSKLYDNSLVSGSSNLVRGIGADYVDLLIGTLLSNGQLDRPMKIRICDLKLFNRAFTDAEAQSYIEKCDVLNTNLVLYSIFNEKAGTKVINYAENFSSYSGELIGNAKFVQDDVPFDNTPTLIKYLIIDGTEVKHWNASNSQYEKIGEYPVTNKMFQDYGQSVIHKERTGLTSLKPTIARWSNGNLSGCSITQVAIPKGQVIKMISDATFSESNIVDIINATVTTTNTGAGILKFIVSTDGGVEWKTWNGSVWNIINANNSEDIKTNGMSVAILQGITEAQWTSLNLSNKKIRFAWYMEIAASTDILKLKQIRVNYNTK
ncbi:hypothetical protein [Clostridium beijerinckii]|uniref:hypothetical protein n=1 Tax=Clostridium beijerinckii TaxID=1520 RepID=UPI000809F363|nr:hypothetical protein [Clostridium beijerinckii]OCA97880.1 hypothetical protein BGS1_02315 [Clostridium beijerinckii]